MARNRFLGTTADVATTVGVANVLLANPSATFTFWSDQNVAKGGTGGIQYTDIKELDGTTSIATYHPNSDGACRVIYGPDGVKAMYVESGAAERFLVQCWTADAYGSAVAATPTSEQSGAITPAPGQFIPILLASANATIPLPSAPADGSQVIFRVVSVSTGVVGAFSATISRGGTDTFDRVGGATSFTMNRLGDVRVLQYQASNKVWHTVGGYQDPATNTAVNNATYSGLSLSDQYLTYGIADDIKQGLIVLPQDIYFPQTTPISDLLMTQEVPNLASGTVVYRAIDRNPTTFAETLIGTMTVQAAGSTATSTQNTRAATAGLGSAYSMPAGHVLRCYVYQANGTGYWGAGPELHLKQSGTFTLPSVPSIPGTITPTPGTSQVALSAAIPTGASDLLYVDTSTTPPSLVGRTATGATVHSGLAAASSHTYVAYGLGTWTASAASSPVTSGPGSAVFAQFNAVTGGLDPAKWTQTNGSDSGTGATVDGSGYGIFTSGAVGSGATTSRVYADYIELGSGTGAVWSAARISDIEYSQYTSNNQFLFYLSRNAFTSLATSFTTGIQFQFNASGIRVGIKTGGSFIILTASGSTQATNTSSDASGVVPWTANGNSAQTASSANFYGATLEALPVDGSGAQTINVYTGTTTQASDGSTTHGSLSLLTAVTLTSAQRSAIPPGHIGFEQDGANGTGATQTTRLKFVVATLSPTGT
jgi:hypothetical protein